LGILLYKGLTNNQKKDRRYPNGKITENNTRKNRSSKGFKENRAKARKINASTPYDTCSEHLSPFGGLLALIKFLDMVNFAEIFNSTYTAPRRTPKLGHYAMVVGKLMLLFIGFNRLWHFVYIRLDAMLCGFFRVERLPAASTFWRYLDSLGINQANSLLKIMSILRERVWKLCDYNFYRMDVDIDTTVETVYGHQQGSRKGHNTKQRGKKGYRPVLCFIQQTREYLVGKLRKGETIDGKDTADLIAQIKSHLPSGVHQVMLRADGEFLSWESVKAAIEQGFMFIFANKRCTPPFDSNQWYRPWKTKDIEYNSCIYKPIGWGVECRFVAMRILKKPKKCSGQLVQRPLFEDDLYTYRIFCTSLKRKAHEVIAAYDKRADVENLVGEAKREGLGAIPSGKFKNNYAFFQIVMLAYNIWRYLKMLAQISTNETEEAVSTGKPHGFMNIMDNTIRIARLKLLMIASKVVRVGNQDKVRYSIHDARTPVLLNFLEFLDRKRSQRVAEVVEV
jgi:hypothetical protein